MNNLLRIVALSVTAVSFCLLIKQYRPELALQVSVIAGIVVLLLVLGEAAGIVDQIRTFVERFGLAQWNLDVLFKVTGMAYLSQFAIQICKDAKENAIASKVEIAGRVLILSTAMPLLRTALDGMLELAVPGG